jgi:GAF domain-containing protein
VTLIDGDRQQIKASFGLPKGLSATRETPLTWSVCQYAVGWGGPMIVCDARVDHWLDDNPAVTKYGLRAYAGVPLVTRQGHAVGALCVIDRSARDWTAEEVADLGDLAEVVMRELRVERLEWRLDHEHSTAVFSSPKPGKRGRTSWRDAG